MSAPPSPPPSQLSPSRASTPSPQESPGDRDCGVPVCPYHVLPFLRQSNPFRSEPASDPPPSQPNSSIYPAEHVTPRPEFTALSVEEMGNLTHAGVEFTRRQFRDQGLPFPESHPFIPTIRETVNRRAAEWRAGVQLLYPNLEEFYLDKIEKETRLEIVYDFLALYISIRRPGTGSNFPTHEANPAA